MLATVGVEPDVAYFHPGFEGLLGAFDFHGGGDGDGVTVLKGVAYGVNDDVALGVGFRVVVGAVGGEFVGAFGADDECVEFVGVVAAAFGAGGDAHGFKCPTSSLFGRICGVHGELGSAVLVQ